MRDGVTLGGRPYHFFCEQLAECGGIQHLFASSFFSLAFSSSSAFSRWEREDLDAILAASSEEVGFAIQLAAHTGLRASDLFRLSWTHVRDRANIIETGKSGHKREAVIPLYADLQELLARIPKRAVTILTNTRKRPWTVNGFSSSFADAKTEAGLAERGLHFHDLGGTAATKFYTAGLSKRVIGEILGWEEESVAKIIRRYVSRTAATDAVIRQLDEARQRT